MRTASLSLTVRTLIVLALIILTPVPFCFGQGGGNPARPASKSASQRVGEFDQSLGVLYPDEPGDKASVLTDRTKPTDAGERELFCLTMRTYTVARENHHSDATRPVGYSRCQPSSKYEVRVTQIPEPRQ